MSGPEDGAGVADGIWRDVDPATSLARGVGRDDDREDHDQAVARHRDRDGASDDRHVATNDPVAVADVADTDLDTPRLVRPEHVP